MIREAGLLFRGFTLVNAKYHQTSSDEVDTDLRSGLITAILNFAENAFSTDKVEYFEGKKFVIAFTEDKIKSRDSIDPELFVAYAILDKEKKMEKQINKSINPLLKEMIVSFKKDNEGKNLSEISQFRSFKLYLDKLFGDNTKSVDQKLHGTFF